MSVCDGEAGRGCGAHRLFAEDEVDLLEALAHRLGHVEPHEDEGRKHTTSNGATGKRLSAAALETVRAFYREDLELWGQAMA